MNVKQLHEEIMQTLEAIVDPCSIASGAPAGLVSMGLVGDVTIRMTEREAEVDVVLFLTEPGCMMGAFFQITARQKLELLEGIRTAMCFPGSRPCLGPGADDEGVSQQTERVPACQARHMSELHTTTTI